MLLSSSSPVPTWTNRIQGLSWLNKLEIPSANPHLHILRAQINGKISSSPKKRCYPHRNVLTDQRAWNWKFSCLVHCNILPKTKQFLHHGYFDFVAGLVTCVLFYWRWRMCNLHFDRPMRRWLVCRGGLAIVFTASCACTPCHSNVTVPSWENGHSWLAD